MNSETMGQKILKWLFAAVYVVIIAVTFSSDTTLPKISSMLIIPIAFFTFLVKADFNSIKKTYTFPMYLMCSILLIYVHSIIIWLVNIEQSQYIIQGSQRLLFQMINVVVAFSAVYIFGSKAIDYTLYSAVTINSIIFLLALAKHGISASIADFMTAIKTGEQEGFMTDMEIHQLTYVYGFFIIYYLFVSDYSKKKKAVMIGLCLLYMVLGFKRIIFAAIFVALVLTVLFFALPEKLKAPFVSLVSCVTAIVVFAYIPLISSGMFEFLMNKLNVDTMSRIDIYNFVRPTYEFSPQFFGKGSDFVVRYMITQRELGATINGGPIAVLLIHNDILVRYIELGFFGFIGWIYFMCFFVYRWLKKHCGLVVAAMYAVMNTTNFINFSVGNTNRDYCVRLVIEIILFATIYKRFVEDKEKNEFKRIRS